MKALTLWQPWAAVIAWLGKDIENRTWKPPRWIIGKQLAIHAGQRLEENELYWLRQRYTLPDELVVPSAIVAVSTVTGYVTSSDNEWFQGPIGWTLDDVVALPEPVPCKGARGLWDLPPEVEAQVMVQLRRAA